MPYDGPNVFLAPYGNEAARSNFQRTVREGVPVEHVQPHTEKDVDGENVRLWGTKESVEGTWRNVNGGDYLFFYRDGRYTYATEVIGTEKNERLGKEVWPNYEEGEPWIYIIYLEEPVELDVDSNEIHDLAAYGRSYPLGFSPLNEMGIGGIRGKYGSITNFVQGGRSPSRSEADPDIDIDVDSQLETTVPRSIFDGLYFPDEEANAIISQINAALNSGKHIIFTGPPGTGKTEVAQRTCEYLVDAHSDLFTGYKLTTATADWSTFETVGGYMPDESEDGKLSFEPGQVLHRFKRKNTQRNELLIIDEINRADIDKAFGQLFTLLSNQAIQLPYKRNGHEIEIYPADKLAGNPEDHEYVMPASWRILATMNSYDKTSLYELSYAFMRRFAFVHIDAPQITASRERQVEITRTYASTWGITVDDEVLAGVGEVWHIANTAGAGRRLGPAIIRDILLHIDRTDGAVEEVPLTQAVTNYLFPQLEGVARHERVVSRLLDVDLIDNDVLVRKARDFLGVRLDEEGRITG